MSNEPITTIRFLAAVALLGGGLTLAACSSSDSSAGRGDSAATTGECKLGDTVDQPATKDGVPACAAEPGVKTQTYACHPAGAPAQGSWYQVQNTNGTVMYGKPGGVWVQAESAGKPESDLVQQIGC